MGATRDKTVANITGDGTTSLTTIENVRKNKLDNRTKNPTKLDREKRIQHCLELMAFHSKREVFSTLRSEYGISQETAKKYWGEAQDIVVIESKKDRKIHIAKALMQVESVIRNEKGALRLKAIQTKISLLGLDAPKRMEVAEMKVPYQIDGTEIALADPVLREKMLEIDAQIANKVKIKEDDGTDNYPGT